MTVGCPACKTDYDDTTVLPNTQYFYKVTATNSDGEGPNCGDFPIGTAAPVESTCVLPGLTILTDATGDALDMLRAMMSSTSRLPEIFGLDRQEIGVYAQSGQSQYCAETPTGPSNSTRLTPRAM